jgi:hypothetical protein
MVELFSEWSSAAGKARSKKEFKEGHGRCMQLSRSGNNPQRQMEASRAGGESVVTRFSVIYFNLVDGIRGE